MTSAAWGQTLSGAGQGAAAGAMFGPYGIAVGAGVGALSGFISGSASDRQMANQVAWADYNRYSNYNTSIYNTTASLAIAGINARTGIAAGIASGRQAVASATYNATMISATTEYSVLLQEEQLTELWQTLDLDINQIEMFRARERGGIVAEQAASGTVIGEGSNALVVESQMTQEAMDLAVITNNADRQASKISNEIAQSRWNGSVAISQTIWEGDMASAAAVYNAGIQAKSGIASAIIKSNADMYTAKQAFMAGGQSINNQIYTFGQQNQQAMVKGLFTAATTYGAGAYARKIPGQSAITTTGSGSSYPNSSGSSYSPSFGGNVNLGRMNRPHAPIGNNLTTPGTSLAI